MKKRILAIATALVLCLTLLPATVLAEEPSQDPARPVVTGAPLADTNQASLSYNESGATTTTTRDYTTLTDALEAISSLPPGATNVVITLLGTDSAYNVATTGNDTTYTLPTGIYTITSKEKGQKSLYFKKGSNSSNDFC